MRLDRIGAREPPLNNSERWRQFASPRYSQSDQSGHRASNFGGEERSNDMSRSFGTFTDIATTTLSFHQNAVCRSCRSKHRTKSKGTCMSASRENRGCLEAHGQAWSSKAVTLASVVRSEGRGKKVQAFRLPSFVASAPRGESYEQDQTTSAVALGAINPCPIPLFGHSPADAVQACQSYPERQPAAER